MVSSASYFLAIHGEVELDGRGLMKDVLLGQVFYNFPTS